MGGKGETVGVMTRGQNPLDALKLHTKSLKSSASVIFERGPVKGWFHHNDDWARATLGTNETDDARLRGGLEGTLGRGRGHSYK